MAKTLKNRFNDILIDTTISAGGGFVFGVWANNVGLTDPPLSLLSCATGGWLLWQGGRLVIPRAYRAWLNRQNEASDLPAEQWEEIPIINQGKPAGSIRRRLYSMLRFPSVDTGRPAISRPPIGYTGSRRAAGYRYTYAGQAIESPAIPPTPITRRPYVFRAIVKGKPRAFSCEQMETFLTGCLRLSNAGENPFSRDYWTKTHRPPFKRKYYDAIMETIKLYGCTLNREGNLTGSLDAAQARRLIAIAKRWA